MAKKQSDIIVGANIKRYREIRGLTREKLAEKVNISPTFITNVENGARSMSIESLRDIASALDVSADSLIYEESNDAYSSNISRILNARSANFAATMEEIIFICSKRLGD